MAKKHLNSISLLKIDNRNEKIDLDMKDCFDKILINFVKTQKDVYVLLETIILSCILTEAIVKEKLREINPALILDTIDPISVAFITNKTKKLNKRLQKENYDVKSASISILLNRYMAFYEMSKYKKFLINFFNIRNCIVHSAKEYILDEKRAAILLTKYVFPFIHEHVSVSGGLWKKVLRIQKVAHDKFKLDLARNIVTHEKSTYILSELEKEKRMLQKLTLPYDEETESVSDLTCPACRFPSTSFITGVDIDGGPDGVSVYGYEYTKCRVCLLELKSVEYTEILENAGDYFTDEQADEWYAATEPPDYSNIDLGDYDLNEH